MIDPAYDDLTVPVRPQRVVLLGASGTIGRATLKALLAAGHEVLCIVRHALSDDPVHPRLRVVIAGLDDRAALQKLLTQKDALISCIASRNGSPEDAWAVDHDLNMNALRAAKAAGITRFVLLSAICVQKPKLAFQRAKLAFEAALTSSGLCYTIVRPTAYFKSLSGQAERLRAGRPFLVFGSGALTACKPISDADLGQFLVSTLSNPSCENRILPVGGPGAALTPLEQGQMLAEALGVPFRVKHVPVVFFDCIIAVLSLAGWVNRHARAKAALARIGRYYATESMLVWDAKNRRYDADLTPEYGHEHLEQFYVHLADGAVSVDRGEHAVF